MKSAVFLLGALAAKCPLQVKKCESHTVSRYLKKRDVLLLAMTCGESCHGNRKYYKFHKSGLRNDKGFRAHDQIVWKIKCPTKYRKVPHAVATSNGLWVRFMQDANSKWQVADNVRVDDFASLNCKKLNKLQPKKLVDIKQEFADSAKRCQGEQLSLKECSSFSAKTFLLPDTQFSKDFLAGKVDTDIAVSSGLYFVIQASVSSLQAHYRRRLNKARVAVFKCGEEQDQTFAWTDIVENEPNKVLVPKWKKSKKSLFLLQKIDWNDRCKPELYMV